MLVVNIWHCDVRTLGEKATDPCKTTASYQVILRRKGTARHHNINEFLTVYSGFEKAASVDSQIVGKRKT